MKGKKLLAGIMSAALVLCTMAIPAFAETEKTEKITFTDRSGVETTYDKVTDAAGNITISNEKINSNYAVAEYELNNTLIMFKGNTLRSVNDLMRAYWEASKKSTGCDYNTDTIPAYNTGDLKWTIYGKVEQGAYLGGGALVLPALSGGYIYANDTRTYAWNNIYVQAGTTDATIVSNENFDYAHSYINCGTTSTTFDGITIDGGVYVVPTGEVNFINCNFTGSLRPSSGNGSLNIKNCNFTGVKLKNDEQYAFFDQAKGNLTFTGNTIAAGKYKRGLNIQISENSTANVTNNIFGSITDKNRSVIQITTLKSLEFKENDITVDGENVFTLYSTMSGYNATIDMKSNTFAGKGYFISDKTKGTLTSENIIFNIDSTNAISNSIDKSKGTDNEGNILETSKYLVTQAKATWTTDTDSGYYMNGETKYGMMRFMFKTEPTGTVTASGIKYINAKDISKSVTANTATGATVFQGDVVKVDEGTEGTYYARAYITTKDGTTFWSAPVGCSVNWNRFFTKYTGGVQ